MEGRCQCGAVRFTTPLVRPLKMFVCHCLECRRQSASAFGITAMFPAFELAASTSTSTSPKVEEGSETRGTEATTRTDSTVPPSSEQVNDTGIGSARPEQKDGNQNDLVGVYEHRNTTSGRTKKCYFCKTCGTRLMHGGGPYVAVKGGCLEALDRELLDSATHIWTKRAVVPIPDGVQSFPEEPS